MLKNRIQIAAIAALTSLSFFMSNASNAQKNNKTVKIDAGTIEGSVSGDVLSFKGIPYAAPPIGNLRWKSPQPVKSWKGVRQAIAYGNDCIQQPIPEDAGASGSTRGEDCLVLNVWRPATINAGQKLPVMVWIHGGGFLNGAASVPFFDGSQFARQGVILVSINYRLGRLGFFAHPALSAENHRPLANYALLDQLAALKWVKKNISAFGGDANQVTIAGESAGGISVVHLLTWSAARGLFHRAVVMSGGGRSYIVQHRKLNQAIGALPSAEDSGIEFAKSVGITDTGAAGLKALGALPGEKVNGNMNMQYFVNFAKNGDPNAVGLPPWSKFAPAKFDLMLFNNDGKAKMQPDPWRERLALVERAMDAKAAPSKNQASLVSTSWQLVKFQGGDDQTLIPDDKAKYTIAFNANGSVNVRIDCNRGRGTWKSPEPNQLQFSPLALTRAKCPPGSLHDRIVKHWGMVRSYVIKDGHLFLSLMADGGIYEFEPMNKLQPVAP